MTSLKKKQILLAQDARNDKPLRWRWAGRVAAWIEGLVEVRKRVVRRGARVAELIAVVALLVS